LDKFKKLFASKIGNLVKKNKNELIDMLYKDKFKNILERNDISKILKKHLNEQDVYHIKDNMYTIDFWIHDAIIEKLWNVNLHDDYSDTNIFGIISYLMETAMWFLIYISYIKNNANKNTNIEILYDIYCIDVLNLWKPYAKKMKVLLQSLEVDFQEIINLWIELDDNKNFFKIWHANRTKFVKDKEDIYKSISGEDVLWFKWFLKNITYYNKRYLMPK